MKTLCLVWLIFAAWSLACAQGIEVGAGTEVAGPLLFGGVCGGTAARTRTIPTGLPTPPILPTCVWAPAVVTVDTTVDAVFKSTYSVTDTNFIFVNPATGSDSHCGAIGSTCATLQKAVSSTAPPTVYYTGACPYYGTTVKPIIDFRYTDTFGTVKKRVIFPPTKCTLRVLGDTIATNAWSATGGGHTAMYQTTIASASGGTSGKVNKVYYQDGTLDDYAYPARLPSAFPNAYDGHIAYATGQYVSVSGTTCYQAIANTTGHTPPNATYWTTCTMDVAGLANLDLLTTGYYYSISTFTLYVKLAALDLTIGANAAKLRATYFQQGNNDPRILQVGTILAIENAYLDGLGIEQVQYFDGVNYHSPITYVQNSVITGSVTYGVQVRGGDAYLQSTVLHANTADGVNADLGLDSATSTPHIPYLERVSVWAHWAGDPQTYFTGGILPGIYDNNNGASVHNGYHVCVSSVDESNLGPEIGDDSNASLSPLIPAITWLVGCVTRKKNVNNTLNVVGIDMTGVLGSSPGDSRNRLFWSDTSQSYSEGTSPLQLLSYPTCKLFNTSLDTAISSQPTSSCSSYAPETP